MNVAKREWNKNWLIGAIALVYTLSVGICLYHFIGLGKLNVMGDLPHIELIYYFSKFPEFNQWFLQELAHPKFFHSTIGIWNVLVGASDPTIILSPNLFNALLFPLFFASVYLTAKLYFDKISALYSVLFIFLLYPVMLAFYTVNDHSLFYMFFPMLFYVLKKIDTLPPLISILILGVAFASGSLAFFIPYTIAIMVLSYYFNRKVLIYSAYGAAIYLPFIVPVIFRMIGTDIETMNTIAQWTPLASIGLIGLIYIIQRWINKKAIFVLTIATILVAFYVLIIDNFSSISDPRMHFLDYAIERNENSELLSIMFSIKLTEILTFYNFLFFILGFSGLKTYLSFRKQKKAQEISPLLWVALIGLIFMFIHGFLVYFFPDYYYTTRFSMLNHQGRMLFYLSLIILTGYGFQKWVANKSSMFRLGVHFLIILLIFNHVFYVQLMNRTLANVDKIGLENQYNEIYAAYLYEKLEDEKAIDPRTDYYACEYLDNCKE